MEDTPEHIKQIQLRIWLAKTPGERIEQFVKDNDDFFRLCKEAKELLKAKQKDGVRKHNEID